MFNLLKKIFKRKNISNVIIDEGKSSLSSVNENIKKEDIKDKKYILNQIFGFNDFKPFQEEIIDAIINGENVLAIMPTGAGKSLCYQIPAIISKGITIVISPLISLISDQTTKLKSIGVECAFINSTLTEDQYTRTKNEILNGMYQIIYVAPERLQNKDFLYIANRLNITMVVVDEAHCISQWGNDFRKSYLLIKNFVQSLNPKPNIAAFTATATEDVTNDIINSLGLMNVKVIKTSFDRPNLSIYKYEVSESKKKDFVIDFLQRNKDKNGIIYCATRQAVDELFELLMEKEFKVAKYHAGLTDDEREKYQEDFIYDKVNVIIATNALGMGIDKPNVNFILHYNCPRDIESYYQEIGRAGRDGSQAECILLYNAKDFNISKYLIDKTYNEELALNYDIEFCRKVYENKLRKLDKIKLMCYSNECIKKYILGYFSEYKYEKCGSCSSCLTNYEEIDITDDCHKVLSIVEEYNLLYGLTTLADALKGYKSNKIFNFGLNASKYYGALSHYKLEEIKKIFNQLLYEGYIYKTTSEFQTVGLTELGREQLITNKTIFIKKTSEEVKMVQKSKQIEHNDLLNNLKKIRLDYAKKENVPAYIVFSDRTLEDMCRLLPTTRSEFLQVNGVGAYKADKYGESFLVAIKKYLEES